MSSTAFSPAALARSNQELSTACRTAEYGRMGGGNASSSGSQGSGSQNLSAVRGGLQLRLLMLHGRRRSSAPPAAPSGAGATESGAAESGAPESGAFKSSGSDAGPADWNSADSDATGSGRESPIVRPNTVFNLST